MIVHASYPCWAVQCHSELVVPPTGKQSQPKSAPCSLVCGKQAVELGVLCSRSVPYAFLSGEPVRMCGVVLDVS